MEKFYHIGHMILDCFRKRPDVICQIDAATGESETNASVLSRSIQLANCLKAFGLVPGDVLALSGKNHLDLHIPHYAALFNGLPSVGVDPLSKFSEIKSVLKLTNPKIAFCEQENYEDYVQAAEDLGLDVKIVTFGDGENSMKRFLSDYRTDYDEKDFKLAEFDPKKVYMWLISTSGTTGNIKIAAFRHDAWLEKTLAYTREIRTGQMEKENTPALNLSPIQWVSGTFNPVGMPLLGQTILQTSAPATVDHVIDVINKYKPVQTLMGPTIMSYILKSKKECDLTCFDSIIMGGAKVPDGMLEEVRSKMRPGTYVTQMYGQTETMGPCIFPHAKTPKKSVGSPVPLYQIKLIDPDTEAIITEPDIPGELCAKGNIFTEYYNSPKETKQAFTADGYYRTGDIFRRDENNNYFYLERIKMLIKYQNYHILPGELEELIRSHPGVFDVAVVGRPHSADGEHAVAFVVRAEGATVTEQLIKDLVVKNLSEKKELRGGVLFLGELPQTSTGKVNLKKLKEIATSVY